MSNEIENLPDDLKIDINRRNFIPIIGAGFSSNAKNFQSNIVNILKEDLKIENLEDEDNFTNIATEYEKRRTRPNLISKLIELLTKNEITPSDAHLEFVRLNSDVILTTNYDRLIEDSIKKIGGNYYVITKEKDLSIFMKKNWIKVIKIHGDFSDSDNMIITRPDYDSIIEKKKLFLMFISYFLITRTPILIGYSFNDEYIQSLWDNIGEILGRMRKNAYILVFDLNQKDKMKWENKNIVPIELKKYGDNYLNSLTNFFSNINLYIFRNKPISEINKEIKYANFDFMEGGDFSGK